MLPLPTVRIQSRDPSHSTAASEIRERSSAPHTSVIVYVCFFLEHSTSTLPHATVRVFLPGRASSPRVSRRPCFDDFEVLCANKWPRSIEEFLGHLQTAVTAFSRRSLKTNYGSSLREKKKRKKNSLQTTFEASAAQTRSRVRF